MEYIPPDKDGVVITEEDYKEGNRLWEHTLVGYVLGQKPGYKAMQRYVATVWKKISPPQIHQVREGVFLFRLFSEAEMLFGMST